MKHLLTHRHDLPSTWRLRAIAFGAIGLLVAASAQAASSASSASSEGSSASVGSLSTSLEQSSKSSTGDTKQAAGPYRIVAVAAAADRPGQLRLTLEPEGPAADPAAGPRSGMVLILPAAAFEAGRLQAGERVLASARDYGLEFARADTREAFFLVVEDDWQRDLRTRPVKG
jgi:hypothetical protein